jgi:hypothetical protein
MRPRSSDALWLFSRLLLAFAGLALLAPAVRPAAPAAEPPPPGRAGYQIGYTAHRVNLPGGQFANRSTSRAFVVEGDGSGARQLAPELTRKPNQWAQFAGWSYDCHPHLVRADGTGLRKLGDRGGYRGVFETLDEPDFHSERSDIPATRFWDSRSSTAGSSRTRGSGGGWRPGD